MNTNKLVAAFFGSILLVSAMASTASAGGLLADLGRATGVLTREQASALDDLHDQYKQHDPGYAGFEEDLTNRTRKNIGLAPHCDPIFDKRGNQIGCQN